MRTRLSAFLGDFASAPLLTVSGVNQRVLAETDNLDRAFFTGLGGSVMLTSVLAVVSSTFGLAIALGSTNFLLFLPFGLGWGLAVLNIDRWLVSGTDGGYVHKGAQASFIVRYPIHVLQATIRGGIRVALAILLGLTFSEPLLTRLFETEVKESLVRYTELEMKADADRRYADSKAAQYEVYLDQKSDRDDALTTAQADWDTSHDLHLSARSDAQTQLDNVLAEISDAKEQNALAAEAAVKATKDNAYFGTNSIPPLGCLDRCQRLLQQAETDRVRILNEMNAATDRDFFAPLNAANAAVSGAQAALDNETPRPGASVSEDVFVPPAREPDPVVPSADVLLAESGLSDRIDALEHAGDRFFSASGECPPGTTLEVSAEGRSSGTDSEGLATRTCRYTKRTVSMGVWAVRLAIISVDVLPVLFKWLLCLFPATPYYRRLNTLDEQQRDQRRAELERTRRTNQADLDRADWLARIREKLLRTRTEAYERSLSAVRVKNGLKEIEFLAEDTMPRDRRAVRRAADTPDIPARLPEQPEHPMKQQGSVTGFGGDEPTGDGLVTSGGGMFD